MQKYEIVRLPYGNEKQIIRADNIDNLRRRMAWYEGTRAGFEVWKYTSDEKKQYLGTIQAVNYFGTMYWNGKRFSLKTGKLLG